eukprot:8939104-Pyramimonas_sp.AAC.1
MPGVTTRAPAVRRRPAAGVASRNVTRRLEVEAALPVGKLGSHARAPLPLGGAGSGLSEPPVLPRPPATPAGLRGGSRRSR